MKNTLLSNSRLKKTIQTRNNWIIISIKKKKTLILIKKRLLFLSKKDSCFDKKRLLKKRPFLQEGSFGRSGHVVYSTGRSRNPPRDTFGGKHCFRGQSCSAVLIFSNPRKAMFAPKSVSREVAGSSCWICYMCKRNKNNCSIFPIIKEKFEARAVRLYSFSATPGKQCLPPKVSLGGLRDRPVEYTTCVKGITIFAQFFHSKREVRGQSCSAVLIFSNPRKAMFASKSVFQGVAGSSCLVYYMCKGNYCICSIFPFQERISRPELFGCNSFSATPRKQCLPPKVSLGGLRFPSCWIYYMCKRN